MIAGLRSLDSSLFGVLFTLYGHLPWLISLAIGVVGNFVTQFVFFLEALRRGRVNP